LIEKNLFWKAERMFFLGHVYSKKKKKFTQQTLDYYQDALNLIENEHITEITWRIVLEIVTTMLIGVLYIKPRFI
jgi:hypothetical protein